MSELLVVDGGTLQATSGEVTIVPQLSGLLDALKCAGKKAYFAISFIVSDPPFTGIGLLVGNSDKIASNELLVVLADASVDVVLSAPNGSTKTVTVSVDDAGQTKVKGI